MASETPAQATKVPSCPSSGTISLDFNDATSVTSRDSAGELEGTSGASILPGEAPADSGGKRKLTTQSDSSPSDCDSENEVDGLNRAMRTVGNWDPFMFTPDCCKKARMDMRLAHARARFVQDKIARLLQESRKLTRTIKEIMNDSD